MSVELVDKVNVAKVQLITEQGENKGEVSKADALEYADSVDLDLVKMNDGKVPVCKVMDLNKYKYEQKQKAKKNKKTKVVTKTKEFQLSLGIAEHDMKIKANKATKAVQKGNKALIVLNLKGRQVNNVDFAKGVLDKFKVFVGEGVGIEKDVALDGKRLTMLLVKGE